jgi:hypothetical protein
MLTTEAKNKILKKVNSGLVKKNDNLKKQQMKLEETNRALRDELADLKSKSGYKGVSEINALTKKADKVLCGVLLQERGKCDQDHLFLSLI